MAFHMVDTPRTEAADKTLLSHAAELDFSTVNSIPSPSKDNNDLVRNMRQKRGAVLGTPRARAPLGDRRNIPSKGEFTPLLKSAAKNRMLQLGGSNKENSHMETPVGLKPTYNLNSPALPLNSSMLLEEHTDSSIGAGDGHGTPIPPVSSSLMSTPMPTLPTRRDGILDDNDNLLTLREQEARLAQIDKENFSLKLKIHFMEEALRKNGKEFNEAAVRENTELKVDKVTLQRDLRLYRKSLAEAEKGLEDYRRQLLDYADKVKRRHENEGMQEDLDRLRQVIADKDAELEELRRQIEEAADQDDQAEKFRADIMDLEAELRERDRQVEEKDDELQQLQENIRGSDHDLEDRLHEKERLLEAKESELSQLQRALTQAESKSDDVLRGVNTESSAKDEQIASLQQKLRDIESKRSNSLSQKDDHLIQRDRQIQELESKLYEAESKATELHSVEEELEKVKSDMGAELRKKSRLLEDKDHELHAIEVKLNSAADRNDDVEKLHDEIGDLQQELREKERVIEEKEDQIDALKQTKSQNEEELDEALIEAHDRIQELETQRERNLREVQDIRDHEKNAVSDNNALLEAEDRIRELEEQHAVSLSTEERLHRDINKLGSDINLLRQEHEDKESEFAADRDLWISQRRSLESEKAKAEEQSRDLREKLDKYHESQGAFSDRENDLKDRLREIETSQAEQQRKWKEKVENLEDEIEVLQGSLDEVEVANDDLQALKLESEGLRRQIKGLQQDLARSQSEVESLQSRRKTSPPSSPHNDLYNTIDDLQEQLARVKKERNELQARLAKVEMVQADTKADLDTLQLNFDSAASSKSQLQQQLKDLRDELRTAHRDAERKLAESERDIQNLEQDLADAQLKEKSLTAQVQTFESHNSRLKSRIATLEQTHAASPRAETSILERKDLHKLLKTAKLEAEDLALQLRASESRLDATATTEASLRTQLARIRTERDTAAAELEHLHAKHDLAGQQIVKGGGTNAAPLQKLERRHAAELRGLARQIEYLSAVARREQAFRAALGFAKDYVLRQVAMYAACNAVDLRLVSAMGIPTKRLLEEEKHKSAAATPRRKLRCAVLAVFAAVRMRRAAEGWGVVRGRHESVLQKLEEVRRARCPAGKKTRGAPR